MNNSNKINYPIPKQEYKVLVRCFTYNQSKYIEETLNSFSIQETNFPFICIVIDDASTDGEQEVIKGWMDRECEMCKAEIIDIPTSVVILVPHKTNHLCTFAFYLFKQNLFGNSEKKMMHVKPWREKCKFEAICEGDDYWTDPLKLQKQVDYLDEHPEYVLSHTAFSYLIEYEDNKIIEAVDAIINNKKIHTTNEDNIIEQILDYNKYRIQTATAIFRIDILEKIVKDKIIQQQPNFLMGDTPLWVRLCQYGKVHFLEENTTIYRQHLGSACRKTSIINRLRFTLSCSEMRMYFGNLYNISSNCRKKFESAYKKDLLNYMLYDKNYIPMFKPYNTILEKHILYNLILSKPLLYIIKPLLDIRKKIKLHLIK